MLLDEDIRDLMQRATEGVTPPSAVPSAIVATHRRRQRRRAVASVALTGAAFGTVALVTYPQNGTSVGAAPKGQTSPSIAGVQLTAAQRTLIGLGKVAAGQTPASGRYVVMAERQDAALRTSVIDSITGDVWTYQKGAGIPSELPVARHDSMTEAQFGALPTDPAALRSYLIAQFDREQLAAQEALRGSGKPGAAAAQQPVFTADDKVFEEATTMLWNPLVGPQLRAALFNVLAGTSGVQVERGATDAQGRPAVKISRYDAVNGVTDATYESPTTTQVLQTTFSYQDGTVGSDLYLKTSRADAVPANPYTP